MLVEVVVDRPLAQDTYTYLVPAELEGRLPIGACVELPFGHSTTRGWVTDFVASAVAGTKLKPITRWLGDELAFTPDLMGLARWMQRYYGGSLSSILRAMMSDYVSHAAVTPARSNPEQLLAKLAVAREEAQLYIQQHRRATAQVRVLEKLMTGPRQVSAMPGLREALRSLRAKGLVSVVTEAPAVAVQTDDQDFSSATPARLTEAQLRVVKYFRHNRRVRVLLHGVTGSGKTEVYLQVLGEGSLKGQKAIVLVPEIALTPQTVARFKQRFGSRVGVYHSHLSGRQRAEVWQQAARGQLDIVVGTRSALFLPLHPLGFIILDEAHDGSYKQDRHPRYDAVTAAIQRAELAGAHLILGSATPLLETYALSEPLPLLKMPRLQRFELPERVTGLRRPQCVLVDLKQELRSGERSPLSRVLRQAIGECLSRSQKVMLLLNRRGFATFVLCRSCGHELRCPHCAVSLTLHRDQQLRCHYCGYVRALPTVCPHCQSLAFRHFGSGVQMLEKKLQEYFPQVPLIRMDRDSTSQRGAHEQKLRAFAQSKKAILLGTQMIAHGHDFPDVGLVGIVAADAALNMPDFRASERTFALITQMVGRTGRGRQGSALALVQSYQPEHPALICGAAQDYRRFYDQELPLRKALRYPPYYRLVRLLIAGSRESWAKDTAEDTADRLRRKWPSNTGSEVLGPAPAAIERLHQKFRWQVLLKLPLDCEPGQEIQTLLKKQLHVGDVQVSVDVDPVNML